MIIIGLILLIAAVVVGVAAVSSNIGAAHTLPNGFTVFAHYFSGSTGMLFLGGVVIGAIGMLGLSMTLSGYWRSTMQRAADRRELRKTRRRANVVPRPKAAPSS
jgi:hypothetical protein